MEGGDRIIDTEGKVNIKDTHNMTILGRVLRLGGSSLSELLYKIDGVLSYYWGRLSPAQRWSWAGSPGSCAGMGM